MLKTAEVVDDFHVEPAQVYELALAAAWRAAEQDDPSWLGPRVAAHKVDDETAGRLGELLERGVDEVWGGVAAGFFAVLEGTPLGSKVAQVRPGECAAVVWLGPPSRCTGGVGLYRPVEQGADGTAALGEWEETMFVPARPNRAVILGPGACFRPADHPSGSDEGPVAQVVLVNLVSPSEE